MWDQQQRRCGNCVHKINIPGNCHIGCNNPGQVVEKKSWPGCGLHPYNFDSNTIVKCDGWSDKPEDKKPAEETALSSLLGQ